MSEGRQISVCPCEIPGLGLWMENRLRKSKGHIITLDFNRESVRSFIANNTFVKFLVHARSDRELQKYVKALEVFIEGDAPAGLGIKMGASTIRRQSPMLSVILIHDLEDAFVLPSSYYSDED